MTITFREFLNLDEKTKIQMGTLINEDLKGDVKDKKLKELEKLLKSHDYFYTYSDDPRSYRKGDKEQDEIRRLVDLIGDDGLSLYRQYLKKHNLIEDKTPPEKNDYEKFFVKKLEQWGITSINQLTKIERSQFMDEVDKEWVSKDEKEKGEKEEQKSIDKKKSMFPEMTNVERSVSLEYSPRQQGERSLTGHSFIDGGNLNYNLPQWTPPTKKGKY